MLMMTRVVLIGLVPMLAEAECTFDEPLPVTHPPLVEVVGAGLDHTCAVSRYHIKCWGDNSYGQLGRGDTVTVGDDEPVRTAEELELGLFGRVAEVAAGDLHTCVRNVEGEVYCWGYKNVLGLMASEDIGDDEPPVVTPVALGRPAIGLAAGALRTCALLDDQTVRCWGYNDHGELGLGFVGDPIGDDESPTSVPVVPVGAEVRAIAAGGGHACVITTDYQVRCWGQNNEGQLGYGNHAIVGDNDTPADAGDVDLGKDSLHQLALGGAHTCALTTSGHVRCWGLNKYGQLGLGHTSNIGDNEAVKTAGYVSIDKTRGVTQIAAGSVHTCALLSDGAVKCWGYGQEGQLGYGNTSFLGDDELPSDMPDLKLGKPATRLTMGEHTCAVLKTGDLRCWGINYDGQLGLGMIELIGDDETPDSVDSLLVF